MTSVRDLTTQFKSLLTPATQGGAEEPAADIAAGAPDAAASGGEAVVQGAGDIIRIDKELQMQAVDIFQNRSEFLDPAIWAQVSVILILLGFAFMFGRRLSEKLEQKIASLDFKTTRKISIKVIRRLPRLVVPAVSAAAFYLISQFAAFSGWPNNLLMIAASLSMTMLVIIFAVSFIKSKVLGRWIAKLAIMIMALHLFGWWDAAVATLQNIRFGLGSSQISLLAILKGLIYFGIFLWIAKILSVIFEKQIKSADELTPSLKVLFSKLLKFILIFIAFMMGLNAIGVDLTSFAILGGAIGVGLGFGLQKIVSNFISGIILLMDRSIKPGDVIAIDGPEGIQTFGWVNTLGARYVSIIRRDGKEHLIPNEVMITERVENWSFSNNDIRLAIPMRVSYTSDLYRARELCLEAASEEPRIKEFPKPLCHVTGFDDEGVKLEIRGWINDPVNGITNVISEVLLRVWDKFHENDIIFPYPQRDLHIRSMDDSIIEKLKKDILADILKETGEKVAKDKS